MTIAELLLKYNKDISIFNVSGIYAIHCSVENKIYIGQARNMEKRWTTHRRIADRKAHTNKHLQELWSRHSNSAFSFHVLELCAEEDLYKKEKFYLSLVPGEYLLNIVRIISPKSEEYRKTLSENAKIAFKEGKRTVWIKGKKHTEETKDKIRKIRTERKNTGGVKNKGRKHTEEERKKMKEAARPPITDEIKAKLKAIIKNRTPEEKAKISEKLTKKLKERYNDPEYRARISNAIKLSWVKRRNNKLAPE
jgi:group I intron endonuclease